jgi:hypothetical protein
VEAGGGVVAHGRQLQAMVLLFHAVEREVPTLPLSSNVLFFSFSSFVVKWFLPLYSLFIFLLNSLPYFKLPRILSFLSLFRFLSFYSLRLLFLFPPVTGVESNLYRAKGSGGAPIAALSLCMGSGAFLPCHDTGLGGQWVSVVGRDPRESHQ